MAEGTKIEWTHLPQINGNIAPGYTANYWWGCTKVSAGCAHCYADTLSERYGKHIWGRDAKREAKKSIWADVYKWNEEAKAAGEKRLVFTSSMCDVFEGADTCHDAESYAMICAARKRVFEEVIPNTPYLIHLLLTKRPENIMGMVPESWRGKFPDNVWVGTSVENQDAAEKRIPHLIRVPAIVRFLSCEPLLGAVDLTNISTGVIGQFGGLDMYGHPLTKVLEWQEIKWVIVGGESGGKARPMNPVWVRSLRDQCQAAGVPFFLKQWGEYVGGVTFADDGDRSNGEKGMFLSLQNGQECAASVRTHFWEGSKWGEASERVGKAKAGRMLDGVEWQQFPDAAFAKQEGK